MKTLYFDLIHCEYTDEMQEWFEENNITEVIWGKWACPQPNGRIQYFYYVSKVEFENDEDATAFTIRFGL